MEGIERKFRLECSLGWFEANRTLGWRKGYLVNNRWLLKFEEFKNPNGKLKEPPHQMIEGTSAGGNAPKKASEMKRLC